MLGTILALLAGLQTSPNGLCVFDFDKTLTRGSDASGKACCSSKIGEDCLATEPYTTYCAGEHPSPNDVPRLFECRPSCRCGTPGCAISGDCPFFNSTAITKNTMGGNIGSNCKHELTPDGRKRQLPAAYARGAVQRCLDAGMLVGLATAELYDPASSNRDFLQGLSLSAFPDDFFDALDCDGPKPCPGYLFQWGERTVATRMRLL
jgi:hypothetical protein